MAQLEAVRSTVVLTKQELERAVKNAYHFVRAC